MRKPKTTLPAKVKGTGVRQLSVSLGETQSRQLEEMRVRSGLRSWGQVIRMLIADAAPGHGSTGRGPK